MLPIQFRPAPESAVKILLLGAHCDDIEIGCGGTILRLVERYPQAEFYWVVFSSSKTRSKEALSAARYFLASAGQKNIIIKSFKNGFFPYVGAEIKAYFEELKDQFCPDMIFTHYRDDLHQDHRTISQLTWNTFRDHLILEYEIPKYDGDMGVPNFFVPLEKPDCDRKVKAILNCFPSQKSRHWFCPETFFALMRLRGLESQAQSAYAEAFYARKLVLSSSQKAGRDLDQQR